MPAFVHPSAPFLASDLTEGLQYCLVERSFVPEFTAITYDDSRDPMIYDRATRRRIQ